MGKRKAIAKARELANREGRTFIALLGQRQSFVYPKDDLMDTAGLLPGPFRSAERVYVAEPTRVPA